jgi:uncharacterized LabA/DUF88 family protein
MRPFKRQNKNKQVYAFIDSQNLNVTVNKLGWKMDWRKLREHLSQKYGVTKAFMFIGYMPEHEDMYEQLHEAGYAVVLKQTYDMTRPMPTEQVNENGKEEERHIKGNVDADMVLWAMKEMPHYSKALIVSGDGDFFSLVEYLVEKKKLLKLLAPSGHYSSLYNKYESSIDRLDQSRRELEYFDRRRKKPNGKR